MIYLPAATNILYLTIAIGAVFGAILRQTISILFDAFPFPVPFATLLVNAFGSLWIGILCQLLTRSPTNLTSTSPEAWLYDALVVGFLGALTTWSTLVLESVLLIDEGLFGHLKKPHITKPDKVAIQERATTTTICKHEQVAKLDKKQIHQLNEQGEVLQHPNSNANGIELQNISMAKENNSTRNVDEGKDDGEIPQQLQPDATVDSSFPNSGLPQNTDLNEIESSQGITEEDLAIVNIDEAEPDVEIAKNRASPKEIPSNLSRSASEIYEKKYLLRLVLTGIANFVIHITLCIGMVYLGLAIPTGFRTTSIHEK